MAVIAVDLGTRVVAGSLAAIAPGLEPIVALDPEAAVVEAVALAADVAIKVLASRRLSISPETKLTHARYNILPSLNGGGSL